MKISLSLAVLGVLMCSTVYAENLSSKSLDTKHAQLCRDKGGLDVTSKIQIKRTSHVKDMVVCQMSKPSSSYNIQSSSSNGSLTVTAPYGEVRTLTDPMGKWVEYQVTGLAVYSYDGPYTDKIADIEMSVTNFCSDEFTQNMNPDYV